MTDEDGHHIAATEANEKKIVMLVFDGIGDTVSNENGTALQKANTPNLNKLAMTSAIGFALPVYPGISPCCAHGHLSLFGYDPALYQIGHETLSALELGHDIPQLPHLPVFSERFQLNPAAIVGKPVYKGIARLLGFKIFAEARYPQEIIFDTLLALKNHDFVFAHIQDQAKPGENGSMEHRVKAIEDFDRYLAVLMENKPDVLIVTGDHSTPALPHHHNWHPVPVIMNATDTKGPYIDSFHEIVAMNAEIGVIQSKEIIPLAMAFARKLNNISYHPSTNEIR
jgi:2,3-bisphosphoglycerate-independent phosphoglycerate mutase